MKIENIWKTSHVIVEFDIFSYTFPKKVFSKILCCVLFGYL